MCRINFSAIMLIFLMGSLGYAVAATPDAQTLLKRAADAWTPLEVSLTATMSTTRPGREPTKTDMRILRDGINRTRIDFLAPEKELGKVILQLGDQTWLYLPRADRKIKVPARKNPLAGGIMFEDLFPGRTETDDITVTETEEGFVLKGKTLVGKNRKQRGTDKIFIERTSLLPFRREYYSRSGHLLKTVHIDEIREWEGVPIPWKIRFIDHLQNGTEVCITIRSAAKIGETDKRLFSEDTLGSGPDEGKTTDD